MICCWLVLMIQSICQVDSFTSHRIPSQRIQINIHQSSSSLQMAYGKYGNGRSSSRYASQNDRTKRQERVGQVVRAELATILHRGSVKNDNDPIESELRRKINIVNADVSPDLRQARITVSIMAGGGDRSSDTVAKRRAYAERSSSNRLSFETRVAAERHRSLS